MTKKRIVISRGQVSGFADDISFDGLEVSEYRKTRVSRVVPTEAVARLLFDTVRACCSDQSSMAAWTRGWKCQWRVVIDGECYGPFADRPAAIAFEKELIYQQGKLFR